MTQARPTFLIIGGPNGAGKSTVAGVVVAPGVAYVNADEIAKTLPEYPSQTADIEAGRLALEAMDGYESRLESFAIETTLASRGLAQRAKRLQTRGYTFSLAFIYGPSPEFSVERVAERVRQGGHHVPEDVIRRRYRAGLLNLVQVYLPIADEWTVYENTTLGTSQIIAEGGLGCPERVVNPSLWSLIRNEG